MSLIISRRNGETFEITWPNGQKRIVQCVGRDCRKVIVYGPGTNEVLELPLTIRVPGCDDAARIEAKPNARNSFQTSYMIEAPRSIHVLRDNAKKVIA